jgi:hypothetical protein
MNSSLGAKLDYLCHNTGNFMEGYLIEESAVKYNKVFIYTS